MFRFSSFMSKVFKPYAILKTEKIYFLWLIFTVFFGLLNIWGSLLNNGFNEITSILNSGDLYIFSISTCAAFLGDMIIGLVESRRSNETFKFATYYAWSSTIIIILIFCCSFLVNGIFKSNWPAQIILSCTAIFVSFYLYCLSKAGRDSELTEEMDDKSYEESRNSELEKIQNQDLDETDMQF